MWGGVLGSGGGVGVGGGGAEAGRRDWASAGLKRTPYRRCGGLYGVWVRQASRPLWWRIAGPPDADRRSAGRPPEVRWRSPRGRRASAHNFGELGAILAEVILLRGSSSEHK